MTRYAIAEAKNNFSKLIEKAELGEAVEITRRGKVVATINPPPPQGGVIDLEWLEAHRITPKSGTDYSWADIVRQMRDEGY